jgi:hypothetical protein
MNHLTNEEQWRRIIVWACFHAPARYIHDDWKVVRQDIYNGKFHPSQIHTHRNLNGVPDAKGRVRDYDVLVVKSRDGTRRLCFHLLHPYDNDSYTEITSAAEGNVELMVRF